jgi:hypothetical protein
LVRNSRARICKLGVDSKEGIYSARLGNDFRGGGHEREISNAGRQKLDFTEIDQCKPVLLGLSLAGNLVKPLLSLYGTEWSERGYGFWAL